jgi:hypothetical protein
VDWFDATLYPEVPRPVAPATEEERIDFVARLCGAWDFGVLPRQETIGEIRRPVWRYAVDECRMLTSVAYHLLREWHGLPPLAFLGSVPAYVREDPSLEYV